MPRLDGYMAGANLGHWISQYGDRDHRHHDTYITAPDFARMASWGLDHVRVPVDYFLFEDDSAPGVYREDGLKYIDFALEQCRKNGLNMVLDLHHAPGYFFGDGEKNNLLTDPATQERYLAIWRFFARRYAGEGENLSFELLNELVWENSDPWNALWPRAVAAIRAVSPGRRVIVGGNMWNAVSELKNLTITDDERVIYTFHDYMPMLFTHQGAPWIEGLRDVATPVPYPFSTSDYAAYFDAYGYGDGLAPGMTVDSAYVRRRLQPAFEFIRAHGRPLYCGEYGVYERANIPDTVRWLNDMADALLEYGIGRAVWSYRGFARVTDPRNEVVDEAVIRAVSRH